MVPLKEEFGRFLVVEPLALLGKTSPCGSAPEMSNFSLSAVDCECMPPCFLNFWTWDFCYAIKEGRFTSAVVMAPDLGLPDQV